MAEQYTLLCTKGHKMEAVNKNPYTPASGSGALEEVEVFCDNCEADLFAPFYHCQECQNLGNEDDYEDYCIACGDELKLNTSEMLDMEQSLKTEQETKQNIKSNFEHLTQDYNQDEGKYKNKEELLEY